MPTAAEQRQAVVDLTTLARRDLFALWATLDGLTVTQTRDALADLLPAIGDTYGAAAGTLAADWFDDLREAAGAPGRYLSEPAPALTAERWQALAGWGVGPMTAPTPDRVAARALVWGGLQRSIADQHRLTIVDNAVRDPQAGGWRRVGVGDNCGFCRMLIDRGHVYSDATVTFRSHDNCNCVASPSWDSNVVRVTGEPFQQSKRNRSEGQKQRDNARAYAFIKANGGD